MNLSQIKQTLASEQIRLTKSLGQNFLHDQNQLKRIVGAARLSREDRVIEIGPGLGPLTALLLERAGHILAIEKDQRLFEFLQRHWPGCEHLTLVHQDALDFLRQPNLNLRDWKVVSNLPYSVASSILVSMARMETRPIQIVVTLQWEVARRIAASVHTEDYGILTLLIQLRYAIESTFKIPAGCFFPIPEVDSACVALVRRDPPLLSPQQEKLFDALVKRSFAQRRKMMLKLLKTDQPLEGTSALSSFRVTPQTLHAAFDALGLAPTVRAEAVGLEQFVQLAASLSASPPS